MSAKIEYKTAHGFGGEIFDHKVNQMLAEGWKLYGQPYALIKASSGHPILFQALTRAVEVKIPASSQDSLEQKHGDYINRNRPSDEDMKKIAETFSKAETRYESERIAEGR